MPPDGDFFERLVFSFFVVGGSGCFHARFVRNLSGKVKRARKPALALNLATYSNPVSRTTPPSLLFPSETA
jgi:hypothetical protein